MFYKKLTYQKCNQRCKKGGFMVISSSLCGSMVNSRSDSRSIKLLYSIASSERLLDPHLLYNSHPKNGHFVNSTDQPGLEQQEVASTVLVSIKSSSYLTIELPEFVVRTHFDWLVLKDVDISQHVAKKKETEDERKTKMAHVSLVYPFSCPCHCPDQRQQLSCRRRHGGLLSM